MSLHWTQRKHSSRIRTRLFSGGFEFETAAGARDYVNEQFAKYPQADLRNTPFTFTVASNGIQVDGAIYADGYKRITSRTYAPGETMRDRVLVASPSDCVWLIPGTEG